MVGHGDKDDDRNIKVAITMTMKITDLGYNVDDFVMTNQQLRCSLLKEAISRGNVITVGIIAVNIRNSMQKKSIAALL